MASSLGKETSIELGISKTEEYVTLELMNVHSDFLSQSVLKS